MFIKICPHLLVLFLRLPQVNNVKLMVKELCNCYKFLIKIADKLIQQTPELIFNANFNMITRAAGQLKILIGINLAIKNFNRS